MRRRKFLALVGGAAVAWPLNARAQQPTMPVIGVLFSGTQEAFAKDIIALERGLKEVGFIVGQNITIEYRYASGQYDRLLALALDLIDRKVDVINAAGEPAALAAKASTSTIPIVFGIGGDPVKLGLVDSLSHPGGNATGGSLLTPGLERKHVELIHELVPSATTIAVLVNPKNQLADLQVEEIEQAARIISTQALVLNVADDTGLESAFVTLTQQKLRALAVTADPFFYSRRKQLAALTASVGLPTVFPFREFASDGGLMSYGTSPPYMTYEMAKYVGRIIKGEKPSDLAVQQATKIELILNLKTAKELGITFPVLLLGRADEVIE